MKNLLYKILLIVLLPVILSCSRENVTEPAENDILPTIPTGFRVFDARDGEVGLEWNLNQNPNDNYLIYRSDGNEDNFRLVDSTGNEYYIDDSLSYDKTYYYKISAKSASNIESEKTSSVFAQPLNLQPPLVPLSVDISARNWDGSVYIYLNWYSSRSTDVLGYEIHRDTLDNFTADSSNIIGFTKNLFYVDTKDVELLSTYVYKLKAVDKGGLKSSSTSEVSDYVLNSPELVFPSDNAETGYFNAIQFKTASKPADYKIVFQTNELFGTIHEINLYSEKIDQVVSVPVQSAELFTPFKKYYWRVFTYSVNSSDPNSYSDLYSFTITAQ